MKKRKWTMNMTWQRFMNLTKIVNDLILYMLNICFVPVNYVMHICISYHWEIKVTIIIIIMLLLNPTLPPLRFSSLEHSKQNLKNTNQNLLTYLDLCRSSLDLWWSTLDLHRSKQKFIIQWMGYFIIVKSI